MVDMSNDDIARRKRRWIRPSGSSFLEAVDGILKFTFLLALIGGLVIAATHIASNPAGISTSTLLPIGVVLGTIALILAPLVTWCVNATVRALRLAPREDAYIRVLMILLLPFIASLFVAWPDTIARWGDAVTWSWFAAIALLIYLFRAEPIEWFASIIIATISIGIGCLALSVAAAQFPSLTSPLYADTLPAGPWAILATGHSPAAATPTTQNSVTPPESPLAQNSPDVLTTAPAQLFPVPPPGNSPVTTQTASLTPPARPTSPTSRPVTAQLPPPKITTPFLTAVVQDEPGLRNVHSLFTSPAQSHALLALKNTDLETRVERWSLNPLEKREQYSYPLFPAKLPTFAVSPRGDFMVALVFFPRTQLEIAPLDSKSSFPRKIIPLNEPQAIPTLLGFMDLSHVAIRWDLGGQTVLQIFSTITAAETRRMPLDPTTSDPGSIVISPNLTSPSNHLLADVTPNHQIVIYNMDTPRRVRSIFTSNLSVKLITVAFSPDNSQIAMYAAVANLPTIMNFKVQTGEMLSTTILSQTPLPQDAPPPADHSLLWLPGGQTWLVNGNDLVDVASGKKFGSLGLTGVIGQHLMAPNHIAFLLRAPDNSTYVATAKLNEARIREAAAELKK